MRSFLHRQGYRFRLHVRALPGTPDIVLPRHGAVILVNGCFWHAHARCGANLRLPKTNRRFWRTKLAATAARDRRDIARLRRLGWRVLVVWECEIKRGRAWDRIRRFLG